MGSMTTDKKKKNIDKLQKELENAREEYKQSLEPPKFVAKEPELQVILKEDVTKKSSIFSIDFKWKDIYIKTIGLFITTVVCWLLSFIILSQQPLAIGTFIGGVLFSIATLMLTIWFMFMFIQKFLPLLFLKLNESDRKNLLKITMFTLTGKIKVMFVKPTVDADFEYTKGTYVVDDNAKYWDGNYYNSYYVEGLPAPLKLKRTSNVQEYYKSVQAIKKALLSKEGKGWEVIKESDIDNLICFSHSAKQLGEYKKDKMFSDMHKSHETDKMMMSVIGFGIVGFVCMVVIIVLVLILG